MTEKELVLCFYEKRFDCSSL